MKYKVDLSYYADAENPCDFQDGFTVHSFSKRHVNFLDPSKIGIFPDDYGDPEVSSKDENGKPNKYKKLFDRGLMFALSYYEHSNCVWSLKGEGPSCRWDSVSLAGVIVLDEEIFKGMRWKKKENAAREFLKEYTAWCNGEVYAFSIEDENGEVVDSCCGFYDAKHMFETISSENDFGENPEFEFTGDCPWLADYHTIETGVKV